MLDKATRNSVCLQQKTTRNSVQAEQAGKENAMTNNEIIFETVRNTFTPAQLAELVQSTYTAEQIAARRAAVTITVDEGSDESAENIFSAMLAADTFHTFAEWKRMGYSVKKGQHAALTCQLWKYTDKPGKADGTPPPLVQVQPPPPGRALMGNTKTKTQEEHKMKTAGYWPCRNEIINAHLSTPHKYEPFTELFDVDQLDAIRDKYGVDLYRECYADALHEVTEAANITTHLRALGVECKPIFTPDDCHVNFIAVFSLGSTTAQRINEIARKADLCVLFQCPTH